jgi:hypothetical protein
MACVHGLPDENCPHCALARRTRPGIRLVDPAPTEIPFEFPAKQHLEQPKQFSAPDLFQPNTPLRTGPSPLERDLAKFQTRFDQGPSLLQARLAQMDKKWKNGGLTEDFPESIDAPIVDVRKKFLN